MKKKVRDTSRAVFAELQSSLQRREQIVYDALKAWTGPAPTAYELTRWLQADDLVMDPNAVRPRLTNMLDKGLVATSDKRACRVTGRRAYTWIIQDPPRPQIMSEQGETGRAANQPGLF